MWGTTRQGRGYNIRKYWQNNIQTVLPCPNPPINTPDSSTTYNHIMMSIYTTHKLILDHTQHTKTVNLKNQDKEPQPAMLNIFPDPWTIIDVHTVLVVDKPIKGDQNCL